MKRIAIIVFILALVAISLMCMGCDGGEDLEGAKKAAEELWQAFMNGDSDAAWELVTAESKESVDKENIVSGASQGVNNVILEEVAISGDEARVGPHSTWRDSIASWSSTPSCSGKMGNGRYPCRIPKMR